MSLSVFSVCVLLTCLYLSLSPSGISLKGVLVPMDDPDDNPPKPKRKKATRGKGGSSQMTDGDYPPLQFTDEMGNENELSEYKF